MSYFSSQGISAGPIKLDNTWISGSIISWNDSKETIRMQYLKFTYDKEGNYGTPLYAGSPMLSYKEVGSNLANNSNVYEYKGKYYELLTPPNSVITAKFLSAYTAIAPGDLTFNPDTFVTQAELNALKIIVNKNVDDISKINSNLLKLTDRVTKNEENIKEHNSQIKYIKEHLIDDWLADGLIIQCGSIN